MVTLTSVSKRLLRVDLHPRMFTIGHFSSTSQEVASTLQTELRVIPK